MDVDIIDITPKSSKKPHKKRKKPRKTLTRVDREVAKRKTADPLKPLLTIGKELVEEGLSKNPKSVYGNWRKLDYKRREIREVEEHLEHELLRDLAPLAHKEIKKDIKNGNIRSAVEVFKKVHRDRDIPIIPPYIKIDQIQIAIMQQSQTRLKEVDND